MTKEKMIKNEQIIRDYNVSAGNGIKKYLHADKQALNTPIDFVCECSKLDCDRHVQISIDAYQKLHIRKNLFTIYHGHNISSIETVIAHNAEYDVVEKIAVAA